LSFLFNMLQIDLKTYLAILRLIHLLITMYRAKQLKEEEELKAKKLEEEAEKKKLEEEKLAAAQKEKTGEEIKPAPEPTTAEPAKSADDKPKEVNSKSPKTVEIERVGKTTETSKKEEAELKAEADLVNQAECCTIL